MWIKLKIPEIIINLNNVTFIKIFYKDIATNTNPHLTIGSGMDYSYMHFDTDEQAKNAYNQIIKLIDFNIEEM